jgi:hypothetical protein
MLFVGWHTRVQKLEFAEQPISIEYASGVDVPEVGENHLSL